ncbi:Phosphoethanolamine N-methyltransferase-related protein [Histomonas meleagridis]|uniref:Phosphoethanolamine N-methyltransferase-related protein n=1 Tax=Histomonas meleagridis TaxID=135588 RepID=UPI00355A0083|nr:Phosphoethanolamine N-methyltransferase-related protein [Histomonas meleagridis]KAH0805753.1 Phosphoethanolamine N-methyltransferase-related protein [Histomonas meleagridis]
MEAFEEEEEEEEVEDFGNPEYWENRYASSPEDYEWYFGWDFLKEKLENICNGREVVLNLGCGNSRMPYEMRNSFKKIYNMDISNNVINQMKEKYSNEKNLIWEQMDCAELKYEDEFFDVIFDKATIDAILCSDNFKEMTYSAILECSRTLKTNGLLVIMTCGLFHPNLTNSVFKGNKLNWELLKTSNFKNPTNKEQTIFLYVLKKLPRSECEDENIDKSFIIFPNDDIMLKILESDE